MNTDYSTRDVPATPEYVLDVLRDERRHFCAIDTLFTDPSVELTFDTTVRDWRESDDLLDWPELGKYLNKSWRIRCKRSEWRKAMVPAKRKTLRDVCDLIAKHAVRPTIRPANLLGKPCLPAGAFLTIRSLFAEAGADAAAIAPSTLLAIHRSRKPWLVLNRLVMLAPGALPTLQVEVETSNMRRMPAMIAILGVAMLLTGLFGSHWQLTLLGGPMFLLGWVASALIGTFFPPRVSSSFGELRTFGDLARAISTTPSGNCTAA